MLSSDIILEILTDFVTFTHFQLRLQQHAILNENDGNEKTGY